MTDLRSQPTKPAPRPYTAVAASGTRAHLRAFAITLCTKASKSTTYSALLYRGDRCAKCEMGGSVSMDLTTAEEATRDLHEHLSAHELDAVAAIATGYTVIQAGDLLRRSSHTVRHQIESAMRKLRCSSRVELVARCFVFGLLTTTWPPGPTLQRCVHLRCTYPQ